MSNDGDDSDQAFSRLVSQSFSGRLTPYQQQKMRDQLERSSETRAFAKISSLIQDSVSDIAEKSLAGVADVGPGLSQEAKARLRDSVRRAQQSRSQAMAGTAVPEDTADHLPVDPLGRTLAGTHDMSEDAGSRRTSSQFTLQRKLGAGGLGTVWLARDERLKRMVALKEIHPDAAESPRSWERFLREAEITGHLEHPNIVPLYQFGTDQDTGQPFYAMRFVGKRTLVDAIEEYHDRRESGHDVAVDLQKLLIAFIGVCQAIAYAHSRGIIHRDLKPENVALDNFGQVVVLDWGLARVSSDYDAESVISGSRVAADIGPGQTMAGEVIGTPLYMAPEQAAGHQEKVDHRTDVYGLGAILFAMLTGRAPHEKSSVGSNGVRPVAELLQVIAESASPRPRDYFSGIPLGLDAIVAKAMEFKQHSRFQSAMELAEAVERWMAGRSERRRQYANARGEGRELRTSMQNFVRDLERNARFMASLPPIQGIVNNKLGRDEEDISIWRERLAVIFRGLLRTNCDFCSVSLCEVSGDQFQEVVRVDRQKTDMSNVRTIPASRLTSGPMTDCFRSVMNGAIDEVRVFLTSRCSTPSSTSAGFLIAGIPVFDEATEEPFGFVIVEAGLVRLTENLIRNRLRSTEKVFVLNNNCGVLVQMDRDGTRVTENDGKSMNSVCSSWSTVLPVLKERGEFQDEQDFSVYATRVDIVPGEESLALVLWLGKE
ncbi:MAG: serine/threonine-protein kinase [Planctomycetaceae bacterium]